MIKLVYCITRKQGMSREAFQRTWLEDHGPLVKRFADALGAIRYVQSHTGLDDLGEGFRASRGFEAPYDGITELWWSSRDDFEAAIASADGIEAGKALLEDERRFIDFSHSRGFVTEEHEIF
jgi:uncharacterized protein (TIGR02118 family)